MGKSVVVTAEDNEALAALHKSTLKMIASAVKELNSRVSKHVEETQGSDSE
ncbi:hypothetical protein EWM64_g8189 [Hericium alpestre]|uniref:Uncharacterized protein n=1 Tax=Hericium alpestre TaxID=135208 RepID=A0A4Y9ZP92_9AGAM|nr:hypothetical protein EWM64_g8189 [Hericium alpestre]